MFKNCKIEYLDLSNFNTSKVYNMEKIFFRCNKLKETKGLNNFNTKYAITMEIMLSRCESIEYLDLSNFDTSNNYLMNENV